MNPRPQSRERWRLRACPALWISPSARLAGGVTEGQPDQRSPRAAQAGVPGTVARLLTRLIPSQAPGAKARYLVCARQRARTRDYDPQLCCCRGLTRPPAPRLATTPTNRPRRSLSSPGVCLLFIVGARAWRRKQWRQGRRRRGSRRRSVPSVPRGGSPSDAALHPHHSGSVRSAIREAAVSSG